jgi:hypothetical protein
MKYALKNIRKVIDNGRKEKIEKNKLHVRGMV